MWKLILLFLLLFVAIYLVRCGINLVYSYVAKATLKNLFVITNEVKESKEGQPSPEVIIQDLLKKSKATPIKISFFVILIIISPAISWLLNVSLFVLNIVMVYEVVRNIAYFLFSNELLSIYCALSTSLIISCYAYKCFSLWFKILNKQDRKPKDKDDKLGFSEFFKYSTKYDRFFDREKLKAIVFFLS